jgi:hypothetical protein
VNAEERAWQVVRAAFEERPPAPPRRRRRAAVGAAVAAAAVVVAAFVSSPGRAVFERVREAVGVTRAAPALFSLPAHGRLLVVSTGGGGVWLVRDNGFKRRLGSYTDAEWSPHGLYLVATTAHELAALDEDGTVHWTLARPHPVRPRWEGTRVDTRIAYDDATGLRVVAGDGTGDHLLDASGGRIAAAWDPARVHTLAYAANRSVVLRRADGTLLWRRAVGAPPTSLEWSSDGRLLAVFSARSVLVLDRSGRVRRTITRLGARLAAGAFEPRSHELAVVIRLGGRSEVQLLDVDRPGRSRLLFAGPGAFGDLVWAPDGRWLLVTWPAADQWLFLHGARLRAVANIREQFPRRDGRAPLLRLAGRWCCE